MSYNLADYKYGLMFVFVSNEKISRMVVRHEFDTDRPMEHSDFDGVVLSHWTRNERFYKIDVEEVNLAHRVFGQHGFGNRNSVASLGLNAYAGSRGSKRAIGNPV